MRQSGRWLLLVRRSRFLLYASVFLVLFGLGLWRNPAFALGIVIFVFALVVSIMLHEFGHFVTAKKFGMQVTQFFVGFGNTIWSRFRGETEYGIKSLPFGGFVKITGMTSIEEVDVADEPRSFRQQPGWQRMIVLAAGSFMHFVLALFILFVLAAGVGLANGNDNTIGVIATCVPASVHALNDGSCTGGLGKSPAQLAGIRVNDKIISIAGRPVGNWNQLRTVLAAQKANTKLPLVVLRDGHDVALSVTLAAIPKRSVPYLGVEPAVLFSRRNLPSAVAYAGSQFGDILSESVSAVAKLPAAVPDLFAKDRAQTPAGQITSVYGVGTVTGDVIESSIGWQSKVTLVLLIVASLNIFVGAFNLLPLLPLDGGHLAIVIFERIRAWISRLFGRPDPGLVDIQKLIPVSVLVFAVVLGLGMLLIAADIFNPVHVQL